MTQPAADPIIRFRLSGLAEIILGLDDSVLVSQSFPSFVRLNSQMCLARASDLRIIMSDCFERADGSPNGFEHTRSERDSMSPCCPLHSRRPCRPQPTEAPTNMSDDRHGEGTFARMRQKGQQADAIISKPIPGNDDADYALWEELAGIARDEEIDVRTRARAIRRMDEITNCKASEGLDDMKAVEEFMADAAQHGYPER